MLGIVLIHCCYHLSGQLYGFIERVLNYSTLLDNQSFTTNSN